MRAEINMILLFPDKTTKEVKGFFKVDSYAEEEDVIECMADFIEENTREYIDDFNTGIAEVFIDDEVYHLAFANPTKIEGATEACHLVVPETILIH